jgi:MFS family permease
VHHVDLPAGTNEPANGVPWYKLLNRYHWFVLVVAALGWLFDTMDQQLFVLARQPALEELLDVGKDASPESVAMVRKYSGYATAIFIVGWATGGLVFGWMGDRLGRARTMVLTILVYSVFTGLSALSTSWWDFAFYRFITGMGVGGEFAAGVSLVAEVMPSRARPYALGLLQALSAVGNMMAAGIFFVVFRVAPEEGIQGMSAWRILFLIGILPALLALVIRRRLKEPESWQRAREEAQHSRATPAAGDAPPDELHKQMGDIREMFGTPRWRFHTIIGVLLAMSGVMGLWGIGFWTPELVRSFVPKEDQTYYVSITSLLQNFGAFFGIYGFGLIAGRMGRRPAFAVAYLAGMAATVMVFGFMKQPGQIYWMIPILGFATLSVFGGFAIYFPELYPTRIRSTGVGFCYNVARYLAAAAPFMLGHIAGAFAAAPGTPRAEQNLSDLTLLSSLGGVDTTFRYAAISMTSVFLIGLVTLLFAPETKDAPLPE